jgi:hypothetical protein
MYDAATLRDLLWPWGEAVKHGYWQGHPAADPDTPRLAAHFGPRLPCHAEYLDLSRAFAALHPATRGLGNAGNLAWFAHVPDVSRQQLGLWLFYVDAWGARKFRDEWKAMSPEARSLLLDLDHRHPGRHINLDDDLRGDELVAARLGIKRRTVYYDRSDAIARMVTFLNGTQRMERAA